MLKNKFSVRSSVPDQAHAVISAVMHKPRHRALPRLMYFVLQATIHLYSSSSAFEKYIHIDNGRLDLKQICSTTLSLASFLPRSLRHLEVTPWRMRGHAFGRCNATPPARITEGTAARFCSSVCGNMHAPMHKGHAQTQTEIQTGIDTKTHTHTRMYKSIYVRMYE